MREGQSKSRGYESPALSTVDGASLLSWRRTDDLRSIPEADGSHPFHLRLVGRRLRLGRDGRLPCRLSHLPDEALHACGREHEQQPRRPRVNGEGVGDVLGAKEKGAGIRLYRLISYVEGQLALEDVEAFVLLVMDMQHPRIAFRSDYLYHSVLPAGLLCGGLDGGQNSQPPPRLSFARLLREGPACANFFSGSVFCGRHVTFLFTVRNTVLFSSSVRATVRRVCSWCLRRAASPARGRHRAAASSPGRRS